MEIPIVQAVYCNGFLVPMDKCCACSFHNNIDDIFNIVNCNRKPKMSREEQYIYLHENFIKGVKDE